MVVLNIDTSGECAGPGEFFFLIAHAVCSGKGKTSLYVQIYSFNALIVENANLMCVIRPVATLGQLRQLPRLIFVSTNLGFIRTLIECTVYVIVLQFSICIHVLNGEKFYSILQVVTCIIYKADKYFYRGM